MEEQEQQVSGMVHSLVHEVKTEQISSAYPKYKEGENDTKAQCKNDRNAKYITSSINISRSLFFSAVILESAI